MSLTAPSSDVGKLVSSVNSLSEFLTFPEVLGTTPWPEEEPEQIEQPEHGKTSNIDVVVICASAVLSTTTAVFEWAQKIAPDSKRQIVLVLCGGIGHSTSFLYEAVQKSPKYGAAHGDIVGLPEGAVLRVLADKFYGLSSVDSSDDVRESLQKKGLAIVVEQKSTNCGANASETRKVLDRCGVSNPRSLTVVQDPTMHRRTIASFARVYDDQPTLPFRSWPTFVPRVAAGIAGHDMIVYSEETVKQQHGESLWSMSRFVDLLLGEIPRLRDDSEGYGPRGKGFIAHVDVPGEVEEAWKYIKTQYKPDNSTRT